jgi:hypothetical protein
VTDLLLRQVQASRAGAQGDDDYDVIGTDGIPHDETSSPALPDGAFSLGCLLISPSRAGPFSTTSPPAMQFHVRWNPPLNARAIAIRMQAPMKPAIK